MSIVLRYAARSDVGLVRSNNQDSGYAGPHLLVLADGMGGPAGGDIASSVAVAHLAPLDDDVHPADDLLPLLRRALDSAHEELMDRSEAAPELAGLGTTCIALLRSGNKLGMVHIGDSRAYLMRGGILTQVTTDHTYVQHLVDEGKITPEEAEVHPHRNMILRALGDTDGDVLLDESIREAHAGDRWLLCSDGLSGMVAFDTIEETLRDIASPDECADALVDLALKAGGTDNITVIVADTVSPSSLDTGNLPSSVPQIVGAAATDRLAKSRAAFSSPAARAAALSPPPAADDDEEEPRKPRRRGLGAIIGVFVILMLLGGGAWAGYTWTQSQYYVSVDDGYVAIFRGIPQEIGPLSFAEVHEVTDIALADLPGFAQDRLSSPITRDSLTGAENVVESLRADLVAEEEEVPSSPADGSSDTGDDDSTDSDAADAEDTEGR